MAVQYDMQVYIVIICWEGGKLNFNVSYTCELNKWLHKDHVLNAIIYGAHAHAPSAYGPCAQWYISVYIR